MSYELIITEKPNAAKKIAEALADGKAIKNAINGVAYYQVTHGDKDIVVGSAVGHLYSLTEKNKGKWVYPVFNVEWKPTSQVQKSAKFSSKYVTALKKLCKDADSFTVATDFDIEGEVIGYNVLRFACKKKDARRMKFSTLTKDELRKSYANARPTLEWGQVNAGLTRHELDWDYGINLSRALTLSIKAAGSFKVLSSGRVQGPALKIIVDREKEIAAFKPDPFWEIELQGEVIKEDIIAMHKKGKIFDKEVAVKIVEKTKGKNGKVVDVKKKEFKQQAPHPFDLTTLQIESYRVHRIQPKATLEIAQDLYTSGYISYPRTSSQQLPESIEYKKVLTALSKQTNYSELASELLNKKSLKPRNGPKTDPAHPAIYPTGNKPAGNVEGTKIKVYDLIVKRFFATFCEAATRETNTIDIDINDELFIAKGTRTIDKGWHKFYMPYVRLEEQELPKVEVGNEVINKKIIKHDKETQPPKRYSQASIIKELEKRGLGTKATRATIVETLYFRNYIDGTPIHATELGIHTIDTLAKYCPRIVDEELTKHFENEMDQIRQGKKKNEEVLAEAKELLIKILTNFKKHEKEIGGGLIEKHREAQTKANTVGPCTKCDGTLMIKRGKFGYFIACSKYPDCTVTFKLPSNAMIKVTGKICEVCNHPMVQVIKAKKRPQILCINSMCKSKFEEGTEKSEKEMEALEKKCPKCKKGTMKVRRSIYGAFLGCDNFPKCRNIEKFTEDGSTSAKSYVKKKKSYVKKKKTSKKKA
jgi:DNA topoisomerase I